MKHTELNMKIGERVHLFILRYGEYPKVYVVTKVHRYRLQVLGYRAQVPGREVAGARQVASLAHRSQVWHTGLGY